MSYGVLLSQVGFINSLKFSSAGDFLVAGVGQEHRCVMGSGEHGSGGIGLGWRGSASVVIHSLQAWPVVEDQRGPELSLHHPATQAACVPCCRLLTLTLFK